MSKLEKARQYTRQTIEQELNMESLQEQQLVQQADKEVPDFLQGLQHIHEITASNQKALTGLKQTQETILQKINQVEKGHWKQIRMLLWMIILPLIISMIALIIQMVSK